MTQRIFDVDNEKDMALLWDILPDDATVITKGNTWDCLFIGNDFNHSIRSFLSINWHDKTEITRPIQEATEADIGKLCKFWDDERFLYFGILDKIENYNKENWYRYRGSIFPHCRRLTKQEIEELI